MIAPAQVVICDGSQVADSTAVGAPASRSSTATEHKNTHAGFMAFRALDRMMKGRWREREGGSEAERPPWSLYRRRERLGKLNESFYFPTTFSFLDEKCLRLVMLSMPWPSIDIE